MKIRLLVYAFLVFSLAGPTMAQDQARIDELIGQLSGFNFDRIRVVSGELYDIGKPAVPALIKALENNDPGIRKNAARILGDLKIKEAIIPISKLLNDQKYWVVRGAVYALGNIGDPAAIPLLQQALKHYSPKVKEAALYSLDELQAKPAMEDITRLMLNDPDQYVRWKAMVVLREIEPGAEIKAITGALRDKKAGIRARRNAAEFAGNLKVEAAGPLLLQALDDPDEGVRWRSIEALGKIGDRSIRKAVEAKLKDPQRDVQMFAISGLGKLGDPASIPALAAMINNRRPDIRKNVIRALGRIGGEEAAKVVRSGLSDRDKYVRAMTVETLVMLNDKESLREISRLTSDTSPTVQVAALHALGKLGGPSEKKLLESHLNDKNFWVKQEAQRALDKFTKSK